MITPERVRRVAPPRPSEPGPPVVGDEPTTVREADPPGGRSVVARLRLHPALVVVFGTSAVLLRLAMRTGLSSDVYWHLAAGRWMLAHDSVIRRDVFSYTIYGRVWTDGEWGFEAALAYLVRTVGPVSFWIVSAGACIGALWVSVARWRRLGSSWMWIGVLTVVAGGCLAFGEAPRPQSASYLFFAVELLVLTLARGERRFLWCLPPLFLCWANVHGSFLAGLSVLAVDVACSRLSFAKRSLVVTNPLPRRAGAVALAASAAATLVNPHGFALWPYELHVSFSPQLAALIEEWQSPNFHVVALLALVIGPVLVTLYAVAVTDVKIEVFDLVVYLAVLVASLHAQRFIPYLGIAWGGLAARLPVLRRESLRPRFATWAVGLALAGALLMGPHVAAGAPAEGGVSGMPVAAATWLSERGGTVFSTYSWNDYLVGVNIPVFVDGRTDLYFGTGILEQWDAVDALTVNPDPVLSRWHVRYVLWPASTPLAVYLQHDPHWRVALRSGAAIVFERAAT